MLLQGFNYVRVSSFTPDGDPLGSITYLRNVL
jgi:hypothetical protein